MHAIKKLAFYFIGICTMSIIAGCATMPMMTMEESVCVNRPAIYLNSKSHICEVSQSIGVPPEEVNNFLLDASAMAYVTDQVEKEEIGKFLKRIEDYLSPVCFDKSYDNLLGAIAVDAEKSALIMRVLNRRLRFYASVEPISAFDCWMIGKAIEYQREQFGL